MVSNGPPTMEQKTRGNIVGGAIISAFCHPHRVPLDVSREPRKAEKKRGGADEWCGGAGAKLKHWRGKLSAERGARGSDKVAIAYTDSEPG